MSLSYPFPGTKRVEASAPDFPQEGLRLCISGGREFDDLAFVWSHLDPYTSSLFGPVTEIGFGCARGVDYFGWRWAFHNRVPFRRYVADWDELGTKAGTIRNGAMLDDFQPDLLLVFPGGTGTRNCAKQAKERGIERVFLTYDDPLEEALRWG